MTSRITVDPHAAAPLDSVVVTIKTGWGTSTTIVKNTDGPRDFYISGVDAFSAEEAHTQPVIVPPPSGD